MIYTKNFDNWIVKKKKLHDKDGAPPLFKERDIWWVSVGVDVGYEEDGKDSNYVRPVLVIKKFNREMFLGVPMSTKLKDNKYYVPVTVKNNIISVMTSQIRVFSSKRIWNKLAELDHGDYAKILDEVKTFFILPPQKRGRG